MGDPYANNMYRPMNPQQYGFGAPVGAREGKDPSRISTGYKADYFTDLTDLAIDNLYTRGQPSEIDGTGIFMRQTVPDKALRTLYDPHAPITIRMNSKETISQVINRVRDAGVQINVDRQGLIYTGDNVPIDSKKFRRVLHASGWFRSPQNIAQYKAKAAIRYAQKWNRAIRSYKSFEGADSKTDEQFIKMQKARLKRANDPIAQATTKIRALRKKYPGAASVEEALEMSKQNVTQFSNYILNQIEGSKQKLAGFYGDFQAPASLQQAYAARKKKKKWNPVIFKPSKKSNQMVAEDSETQSLAPNDQDLSAQIF